MVTAEESQIVVRAREGSSEAINQLFARYGPKLLALIRLRMGPGLRGQMESVDVMQQTVMKAFERFDRFEGSGEATLMAWLAAIAKNEILDQHRHGGRAKRDVGKRAPVSDLDALVAAEVRSQVSRLHLDAQMQQLEAAIEALSEDHRDVILMRRYEELSFAEIGERMGRTPDACRMLYSRAMAALTLRMKTQGEGAAE